MQVTESFLALSFIFLLFVLVMFVCHVCAIGFSFVSALFGFVPDVCSSNFHRRVFVVRIILVIERPAWTA